MTRGIEVDLRTGEVRWRESSGKIVVLPLRVRSAHREREIGSEPQVIVEMAGAVPAENVRF